MSFESNVEANDGQIFGKMDSRVRECSASTSVYQIKREGEAPAEPMLRLSGSFALPWKDAWRLMRTLNEKLRQDGAWLALDRRHNLGVNAVDVPTIAIGR